MNKIIHFSIDDCIEIFRDITINNYNSLFESDYFSFFKELHDKYNAKISLYSFVEYKEFNIKNTTDKFKKEFINNSDWLKIGFHGFNENSRYNGKENIKKDYKLFIKYVKRFAGNLNIIDNFVRLHYFSGNLENILKIKKFGIKGLFTADDDRDNYYLKKNENIFLNKHNIYKDIKNEIFFIKTNLRIEKIENINETLKTIDINNNIIMFTHEEYLNNKNIRDKIIDIYEYSKETHKPDFINFVEDEFKDIKLDKIKKFIDCYIPITTCNFRCPYCYITQNNRWNDALPEFKYSAQYVRKALSKERLGGTCLLNMCGGGETLLPPYIIELLKELLEEGHYIWVITNGSLNKRFEEISKFPKNLLYRLAFKFSFHYLELKRLNKLEDYVKNIKLMQDSGASFSIEITPYDELIEYIDEIKEFSLKNFGALPHITVAREDNTDNKKILTKLSKQEYNKVWSQFNSKMFSFKLSTFLVKRKEYCYAGKWSYILDIGKGVLRQCYSNNMQQNIFENMKPIKIKSVGRKCLEPHCYNSHAFLTWGDIPRLKAPYYYEMRNRIQSDEKEWLNPYMKEFCSHKLKENNNKFNF